MSSTDFQLSKGLEFKIFHARCEIQLKDKINLDILKVSADRYGGGRNFQSGATATEINSLSINENYQTSNTIDTISSSNATDAVDILLKGLTLSAGVFTAVEQIVTIDGQNKVPLLVPLARIESGFNNDGILFLGDVYVYEDTAIVAGVPADLTKAHLKIEAFEQQSLKSVITVPTGQYFLMTNVWASIARKQASVADIRLRIREQNKVFRTRMFRTITQDSPLQYEPPQVGIIRPGSDVVMTISTDVNNVEAYAGFDGIFMSIIQPS